MTWEPKNGLHDEDVDVSEEEEDGDNSFTKDEKPNALGECLLPPPLPATELQPHHLTCWSSSRQLGLYLASRGCLMA